MNLINTVLNERSHIQKTENCMISTCMKCLDTASEDVWRWEWVLSAYGFKGEWVMAVF